MSGEARYSCKEVIKPDGSIHYDICDPQGESLAEVPDFGHTETLLGHLNGMLSKLKPKPKRER